MTESPQYEKFEQIQGVVERLTFHSDETGYTVARVKVPRERDLVTIVGSFPDIQAGQTLQLSGLWRSHPKYGAQFEVKNYQETKPATLTGLEKYLGSGLIKGVGPVTAKRIVAHFELETLDIIENQIERLIEVPGIAKKRIKMIQAAWEAQKSIKEVMLFLQSHGVSTVYAVKIFKQYGNKAIATVTDNPYQLALDVYGIGFITADAIARNIGIEVDSEFRITAGILYALEIAGEEGHCFLPQEELIEKTVKLLTIKDSLPSPERVQELINTMVLKEQIIKQNDAQGMAIFYKPVFFHTEQNLATRLQQLVSRQVSIDQERVKAWIDKFIAKTNTQLSTQQRQAVEMAASSPILILTGGPGCGKTFTTRTIVALWKAMGKEIALASPTGRAAQRLKEMTGKEAKTLHRLLEFDPSAGFKRDHLNPISAQAIIIDEASMLDIFLAGALIRAIPPEAQLLLVGDIDQLPSVGPGNVLRDLIASAQVPVVRLTEVFRQAQASKIVSNAHLVNQGHYPHLEKVSNRPLSDCLWLEIERPEDAVQGIQDVVKFLLPQMGFNPTRDAQVLCPMNRGEVGARNLNEVLQHMLNPPTPDKLQIKRGGGFLREGDRVMQLVNDYDREVFNGDLGTILSIDLEEQEVIVNFGDRSVTYDNADLNELTLAWAVTVHKSQGSEYPVAILPIYTQHYLMLSRNLFYTGLTRAKQLAIIVGNSKAIGMAVRQVKDMSRYTLLAHRLQEKDSTFESYAHH